MIYEEEFTVFGQFLEKDYEGSFQSELSIGSVEFDPKNPPIEIEINGVVYVGEF